jgi:hypothetical protein
MVSLLELVSLALLYKSDIIWQFCAFQILALGITPVMIGPQQIQIILKMTIHPDKIRNNVFFN